MAARTCAVFVIALAALVGCADRVGATTIVPMSDRDLVSSSRAIVEGIVITSEAHAVPDRSAVYTYVTVDVERVVKGDLPVGEIVLRQLGGITEEQAFVIHSAPDLVPGERVLLFLNTDEDGSLHVAHMRLGAFRIVPDSATGVLRVQRDMGEGMLNPITRDTITWSAPYEDFMLGVEIMLGDAPTDPGASDRTRTPMRLSPPEYSGLRRGAGAAPAFSFLGAGFRWFEPDTDRPVRIKVNNKFAFTPSGGIDEVKLAFQTWSSVSGSSLTVMFDGITTAGGLAADGVSSISYGDPKHQIDDLVNCQGVIALASVIGNPGEKTTIGHLTFSRLLEGDLILNNGIECVTTAHPLLLEEVLTHEFGHDIGLGHSSERFDEPDPLLRNASMYFIAHNDGRGSALQRDDSDAIRFLYAGRNGPLVFRTTALPDAVLGQAYDRQLEFSGGTSPYTVTIVSGGMPSGISMGSTGRISGMSNLSTTSSMTVRVTDSDSVTVDRSMSLRVSASPAPFVEKVKFTGSKLQITGLYLDAGATVSVNGVPTEKTPKYKPAKATIVVSGSASSLHLRRDGTDVVVVTIAGLASNAFTF